MAGFHLSAQSQSLLRTVQDLQEMVCVCSTSASVPETQSSGVHLLLVSLQQHCPDVLRA